MTGRKCPICASVALVPFLHRVDVPVHQNLIVQTAEDAKAVARGDLYFVLCENCGFVFNLDFDFSKLSYGENYENTQCCSAYFDDYLNSLVHNIVQNYNITSKLIVEVGCGKGHFLKKLVEYPQSQNIGHGFDPSYVGDLSLFDGRLHFYRCYYEGLPNGLNPDIVICRHVIEHIADPLSFLRTIHASLSNARHARVFFETPCVEWILRNKVFWDFFHEHCSLFCAASLKFLFEQAGFSVRRVEKTFGGQYLWAEAVVASSPLTPGGDCGEIATLARAYQAEEATLRQKWLARLLELHALGGLALWGAGAKGATFANLMDPDCALIDCVIDVNPKKQGRFIPGSGHPVVAPSDIPKRGIRNAILMNSNYFEEIQQFLQFSAIEVNLIDWS